MTEANKIKLWNDKLYYQLLDWKDKNPKKFQQLTRSEVKALNDCNSAEIASMIILIVNDNIKI